MSVKCFECNEGPCLGFVNIQRCKRRGMKTKSTSVLVNDENICEIVRVDFLDHCEDSDKPVTCSVYGRLIEDTAQHLVVESWTSWFKDKASRDENAKRFVIVKGAILRSHKLVENRKINHTQVNKTKKESFE